MRSDLSGGVIYIVAFMIGEIGLARLEAGMDEHAVCRIHLAKKRSRIR